MLTRDSYVALLEKRAADAAESAIEPTDSAQLTTQQYRENMADSREYLHGAFSQAGAVEGNQSATVKKLFNNIPSGAIVGTPLMKVARAIFDEAVEKGVIKTASPIHAEVAYRSFIDELEKIAALKPQTLTQVAAKNQTAMRLPQKTWDLSSPMAAAGSAALPQGSGTSVNQGGFLSRLLGR